MKQHITTLLRQKRVRYLVVGGSSFCIEYASFAGLLSLTDRLVVVNTLSFTVGLVYSFCLHKLWSFAGDHQHKTHYQFVIYAALALVNIILSNVILLWLVNHVGIPAMLSKIFTMVLVVVWNYILLNKVVFRTKEAI